MPREKNQPSVIQRDPERFGHIVAAIKSIGVDNLVSVGLAGKTSFFKYKKGDPVNPRVERNILQSIDKSGGEISGDLMTLADQIISKRQTCQS